MLITIATPYLPFPDVAHGGGQDLFNLVRAMGVNHEIRLVSFVDPDQASHAEALRPYVAGLHLVKPAVRLADKIASAAAAARRGQFWGIGQRAKREMRAAIQNWPAEVVHCAWTEMGRYLAAAPQGAVTVLEEMDVRFAVESASRRPRHRWRQRKAEELAYCRTADLVVTRSRHDLNVLRDEIPGLNCVVVPPVAHIAEFNDIGPGESLAGRVLFLGAMNRRRNQEAAIWLVDEIWPIVRAACPQATLHIAGAAPPAKIKALERCEGVIVTGFVGDLRRAYAEARVVVAPMRSPAGALNKVLDGLAAGRPVVGTQIANRGVAAPKGAMQTADGPDEFAHATIKLLLDNVVWAKQAEAGRRFVRETFDWQGAVQRYEAVLCSLARSGRKRRLP